jgi:hypothetical protein
MLRKRSDNGSVKVFCYIANKVIIYIQRHVAGFVCVVFLPLFLFWSWWGNDALANADFLFK